MVPKIYRDLSALGYYMVFQDCTKFLVVYFVYFSVLLLFSLTESLL